MTAAADSPPAAQPDGIPWERGRPARILSLPTLPPPPPDPGVNHKHPLHHKLETGFTSCQAMGQGALCRPQDHSPLEGEVGKTGAKPAVEPVGERLPLAS